MASVFTDFLEELEARTAIEDCLKRFARAVDRQDWQAAREAYHDDAFDDHDFFKGPPDHFLEHIEKLHAHQDHSMHFNTNVLIDFVSRERAFVETYALVLQRYRAGAPNVSPGTAGLRNIASARYLDRFEKRNNEWRVVHRTLVFGDIVIAESIDMMVQTAPEREPHFVITMKEHMDLCGQLARAYGNDHFESLRPYEEVLYVVDNHDRGWDDYDRNPGIDPSTRLPYLMSRTPAVESVKTNRGSPDFNEVHHPYCGLLSSMHTWGLYNRRYGFTQFVVRTRNTVSIQVADPNRPMVDKMLADEVERQGRLRQALAKSDATRPWVEDKRVFQNYKQLTFFDTLSLYFHLYHASERGEEVYIHVPTTADSDSNVTLKKISDQVYSLDPFPFAGDTLTLACRGRYVRPFADDYPAEKVGATLASMPTDTQVYQLVPER